MADIKDLKEAVEEFKSSIEDTDAIDLDNVSGGIVKNNKIYHLLYHDKNTYQELSYQNTYLILNHRLLVFYIVMS